MLQRTLLLAAGAVLIGVAALASNSSIERATLGRASGELAWGPALFRVLFTLHGMLLVLVGLRRRRAWLPNIERLLAERALPSTDGDDRSGWLWLIILTGIALGLRLWKLNSPLWLDEILTLTDFVRQPLGRIVTSFPNQNQHLLYSLLGHASVGALGESAWALRLPAVVFGIAGIWALFLLGRRTLGTREALMACALMTFSYHHIWFSQNARGYSGLLCFSTLATWLWLEARERNTWPCWGGYVLSVVAGMMLHTTMAFVVAAHGVLFLIDLIACPSRRASWWRPLIAWSLAITITLQFFALAMPEFIQFGLHERSMKSRWTNPSWVILETLRHVKLGFGLFAGLAAGLLVIVGWLSILRTDWRAGLVLVLPMVLSGGTMILLGHNIWPRFFFFAMGFALLIVMRGATCLSRAVLETIGISRNGRMIPAVATAVACTMILASAATVPRCYALPKQDYGGAREYVERSRGQADATVAVGLAAKAYARLFAPDWINIESYPPTSGARPATLLSYCEDGHCRCRPTLEQIMLAHNTVWLTYTLVPELEAFHPPLFELVRKEFRPVAVFPGTLGGGEITVCRYDRPTP